MMDKVDPSTPRIVQLADRIQEDIRRRALEPGDPYLTTMATARMLGVNNGVASRALQLLAKRRVIERRQHKGTFILDPAHGRAAPLLERVHLLVRQDYFKLEGVMADGVVIGLQKDLPGTDVHFNFLPEADETQYVERLVRETLRHSGQEGFVLVRAPLAAQRLVAESGLPAVLHGTLYPSITNLASIDRDQYQVGRLLCRHLLERGCRKVLVLMRQNLLPGDHPMLDAVRDEIDAAGLRPAAMTIRYLPVDEPVARRAVLEILTEAGEPTGVVARNEPLACIAQEAVDATGPIAGRQIMIVLTHSYRKTGHTPRWPHVATVLTPEEIGHRIGHMLAAQVRGQRPQTMHETLAVRVHVPAPDH